MVPEERKSFGFKGISARRWVTATLAVMLTALLLYPVFEHKWAEFYVYAWMGLVFLLALRVAFDVAFKDASPSALPAAGGLPEKQVRDVCELLGYGRVMQIASVMWQEKAKQSGPEGTGFVIGPHVAMTVHCGCNPDNNCEWCCGCGWLTKHVKALKEASESGEK